MQAEVEARGAELRAVQEEGCKVQEEVQRWQVLCRQMEDTNNYWLSIYNNHEAKLWDGRLKVEGLRQKWCT